jgi:hypothetical protein
VPEESCSSGAPFGRTEALVSDALGEERSGLMETGAKLAADFLTFLPSGVSGTRW